MNHNKLCQKKFGRMAQLLNVRKMGKRDPDLESHTPITVGQEATRP